MEIIRQQLEKLENLVKQYPRKIPLGVAADFLDMNEEGLKAALMRGNAPFGFAYQKNDGAYRVMVIPTVTFYLWYTNCHAQMILRPEMTHGGHTNE